MKTNRASNEDAPKRSDCPKKEEEKRDGNIKVYCRFRPFNQKQIPMGVSRIHRLAGNKQLLIKDLKGEDTSFIYDQVFDTASTQEEVFEQVGNPILSNILDGFNGTIMAYGQTSSGKTHTMQGSDLADKQSKGLMPRIIQHLFGAIANSSESIEYKLKVSIFEIYNQKIRDLLDVTKNDLRIRENKQGCYLENITEIYVGDKLELTKIIMAGQKNRVTCATNMNQHSSRSHMIFSIVLNQFNIAEATSKTSKLFVIDLAGSEKVSKTGAEGKVLEEAKKINLSLTTLGKVIKSLSEKDKHVCYRDSKLTRILQDSLGGNSKTTLIVTCSPHEMHLHETLSTLRFGESAQKVKNKPKINREPTIQELQKIIEKLEGQNQKSNLYIKLLEEYITKSLQAPLPKGLAQIQESPPQDMSVMEVMEAMEVTEVNSDTEQRVRCLEQELKSQQASMKHEMEKYYQLKKEYNELHGNIRSIMKENMEMQEALEKYTTEAVQVDKVESNCQVIKLIVGQIFSLLGKEKEASIVKQIETSSWYKRVMVDETSCSDYWHNQKEEIMKQMEELACRVKDIDRQQQQLAMNEESDQIIELEDKIDKLYIQYTSMVDLQTSWKVECQLYQRRLRDKESRIEDLEADIDDLREQMEMLRNQDYYENVSTHKKMVKLMRGGKI